MPEIVSAFPSEKLATSPLQAAYLLAQGGILLYPTETCYALGCLANNQAAVNAIFAIKRRPLEKTLPLLAGSVAQASLAAELEAAPPALIQQFWPGPLTIVLPASALVAQGLRNARGMAAIRATSHATAARVALAAGFPLVSTSANLAGRLPAASLREIDADLFTALEKSGMPYGILANVEHVAPKGVPSTIVEAVPMGANRWKIHILREGAIDRSRLCQDIFDVVADMA